MPAPLDVVGTMRRRPQFLAAAPRGVWTFVSLARELYAVPALLEPTRAQLEAVRRAVAREARAGRVRCDAASRTRPGRPRVLVKLAAKD